MSREKFATETIKSVRRILERRRGLFSGFLCLPPGQSPLKRLAGPFLRSARLSKRDCPRGKLRARGGRNRRTMITISLSNCVQTLKTTTKGSFQDAIYEQVMHDDGIRTLSNMNPASMTIQGAQTDTVCPRAYVQQKKTSMLQTNHEP